MGKNKIQFWEFEGRREAYRQALILQIVERAEKFQRKGYLKSAIVCYEGAMKNYWNAMELQHRLARLYYETGDQIKAGRYFYFKEHQTETEEACVRLFEQQFGNDPVLILRRLLNKDRQLIKKMDPYTKQKINELICAAEIQLGYVPVVFQGIKRHFDKLGLK
ncbi:MAG: DUF6584 family protein [Fluviicola sp.]